VFRRTKRRKIPNGTLGEDTHGGAHYVVEPQSQPEYLTPGEVARMLHVSPKTVNRWAHEGRIGCIVTLGGHRRFERQEVERIVEQMSSGSGG
jgi:excisionase family DNA binding protein